MRRNEYVADFPPDPLMALAENPVCHADQLEDMEFGLMRELQDKGSPRADREKMRTYLSAVRRNPSLGSARLRTLLKEGDPDAWVNPSLEFVLLERPLTPLEHDQAMIAMGLRLADVRENGARLTVDRLQRVWDRLHGITHPAWRRWHHVLDGLVNRQPAPSCTRSSG